MSTQLTGRRDNGPAPAGQDEPATVQVDSLTGDDDAASGGPTSRARWQIIAGRVVLWGTVAVVLLASVVNVADALVADTEPAQAPAGQRWPAEAAQAWSAQLADAWLGQDTAALTQLGVQATPAGEPIEPATVLPAGSWQTADGRGVVAVAAKMAGSRWLRVQVPVAGGRDQPTRLAGEPAIVAAGRSPEALRPAGLESTSDMAAAVRPAVEGFMEDYGGGQPDALARWLTGGTDLAPLDGLEFGQVADLSAGSAGSQDQAVAYATVLWQLAPTDGQGQNGVTAGQQQDSRPPAVASTYRIELARQGGEWYVAELGPATASGPSSQTDDPTPTASAIEEE